MFGGFSLDNAQLLADQGARRRPRDVRPHARRGRHDPPPHRSSTRIACDAVEGGVVLANWFDDDAILRERQEFMAREFDVHWKLLSHDELGAYTRSQRYAGGLLEPDAFHFHPLKYARGLAAVDRARGRPHPRAARA